MTDRDSSPDYASTTHSEEKPTAGRKLGGVRKTVGDPNYVIDKNKIDIPEFDFGVTQSLTPEPSRPGTAVGRVSPLEIKLPPSPQTPIESRKLNVDRVSPGRFSPLPSPQSRPSSRQMWQPRMTSGSQSPGGLTAEEFVQQRAALARLPGNYVPRRTMSTNKIEEMMISPEEQAQLRRQPTRTHSRPSSRGSLLDFSATLSAREREHVARMSGSSLLNLTERSQTPDPNIGLIGAISAREQDKRNMKEGISNHLTQTAIAQRQQQAHAAYMHQLQAQHRPAANVWGQQQQYSYGSVGYYPQQTYYQQPYLQPQHVQQQQRQQQQAQQQAQQQQQQQYYQSGNQYYGGYFPPQGGYQRQ